MNKEEKVKVVEELKGQLNDYKSIYLTDIAGLDAMQTSKLRRECFNSNVKLSVVKNTFLQRAMSESENDFGELKELLSGNTTIMLSPDWETVRWVFGIYVLFIYTKNSSCPKLKPVGAVVIVTSLNVAVWVPVFMDAATAVLFNER